MSYVKKLTMDDFEQQRKQQEDNFRALNMGSFQASPGEPDPARPPMAKQSSAEPATMPLSTALPVTNKQSASAINPNQSIVQVKKPRSRSRREVSESSEHLAYNMSRMSGKMRDASPVDLNSQSSQRGSKRGRSYSSNGSAFAKHNQT